MKRRNFLRGSSLLLSSSILGSNLAYAKKPMVVGSAGRSEEKKPVGIAVTAPSTVGINERFSLGIRVLTNPFNSKWIPRWQRTQSTVDGPFNESSRGIHYIENVLPGWEGTVNISGNEGYRGLNSYSFSEGKGPYQFDKRPVRRLEGFSFTTPGIKYINVVDPVTGIMGLSNPIVVEGSAPKERLFWGELHCHSFFGDGIRTPEELQSFARDESFLDIFALTDHVEALSDAQWNYFREVCNTFDEPGKFVSFNGGEWTSAQYGHHNFIYPGNEGPILRCTDPDNDTLEKLYASAKKYGALIIANHPASAGWGFDWMKGHDPEVERLVEVYSNGGSYEMPSGPGHDFPTRKVKNPSPGNYTVDGLKKGFRLGMIGTGDVHDGRPGDSLHALQKSPESYKDILEDGLMGVWAGQLTRQSVFNALWNRRVYGTTNNRTWLKFSINGQPMGSEFSTTGKLNIKVEAASSLNIQRVELIKEGEVVQYFEPGKMQMVWDPKGESLRKDTWYYVRLIMDNENLAWSSPVWVNRE